MNKHGMMPTVLRGGGIASLVLPTGKLEGTMIPFPCKGSQQINYYGIESSGTPGAGVPGGEGRVEHMAVMIAD